MGSLSLRPGDSLTIPRMALSVGFICFVSSTYATQATGLLTLTPTGLTPVEHASLRWTHCLPKTPSSIRINSLCRAAARSVTCYIGDVRVPMEFSVGRAARTGESGQRRQQMENQDGQIAHFTILTISRNRRNAHGISNSPCTAPRRRSPRAEAFSSSPCPGPCQGRMKNPVFAG